MATADLVVLPALRRHSDCDPRRFRISTRAGAPRLLLGTRHRGGVRAITAALIDSPPNHIERWRQGAEGEKATAKALRPLVRDGWGLLNDIDTGRGNIDHLLIGPPGVFLLDSKNLSGVLSVNAGVLSVRWREDLDDGYENFRLAGQMRARARDLEERLRRQGIEISVQPVVVLWGNFEQRSLLSRRVAWVQGNELHRALRGRPARHGSDDVERASLAMSDVLATGALPR